jgi:magnesium-protoporphyrin O-methyltransferase
MNCCDPVPYRRLFNSKEAKRRFRKFRKKGLDARAADLVAYLKTRGIDGMSLLEVGGGIGEIQVALLASGVTRAVDVELSDAYADLKASLAEENGVGDRIERHIGDFVELAPGLAPTDLVILNRVICCYPFMSKMMEAATGRTQRFLGMVFPREKWWTQAGLWVGNRWLNLRQCGFQAFVHSVQGIEEAAGDRGLQVVHRSQDWLWHSMVFERK